jgi:hypothetical protein
VPDYFRRAIRVPVEACLRTYTLCSTFSRNLPTPSCSNCAPLIQFSRSFPVTPVQTIDSVSNGYIQPSRFTWPLFCDRPGFAISRSSITRSPR